MILGFEVKRPRYTKNEIKMLREGWKDWKGHPKDFDTEFGKKFNRTPGSIAVKRSFLGITAYRKGRKTRRPTAMVAISSKEAKSFNYCPHCGEELR